MKQMEGGQRKNKMKRYIAIKIEELIQEKTNNLEDLAKKEYNRNNCGLQKEIKEYKMAKQEFKRLLKDIEDSNSYFKGIMQFNDEIS